MSTSNNHGPQFKDLSFGTKAFLREWLRLAKLFPPDKYEDLPVEYTRALADLAREERADRGAMRHGARQAAKSNKSRSVRNTKAVGMLAT